MTNPLTWKLLADRAGATAGAVCALHCALTPVAWALLPALAAPLTGLEEAHVWIVGSLSILAIAMTVLGWRRHRRFYATAFLVPGLTLLWGAVLAFHGQTLEHVLMAIGGTLVACAHLVNLRLSHGHVHDACCRHPHR